MQNQLLNPKDYIKNHQSFQDYICNICYQICVKPAKCLGSCRKIFCLRCVSESRMQLDKCPMRCSSPFEVQILPELKIQFECPYNKQQCKIKIHSLEQFNDHYKKCQYVPNQQIQFKRLKSEFRCLKSHRLQFFIGSFEEMCNSKCSLCHQKKLCRAICRQCDNSLYCVECRTPPCQKGKCPIGHEMKLWKSTNLAYICDICGISSAISSNSVYDDPECNFGICEQCFKKITKTSQEDLPKIKLQSNKHDECENCHKLTISKASDLFDECSKCHKIRQCVKECVKCNKKYCLSCKIATVQGDQTCSLNHQFLRMNAQTLGYDQHFSFKCMKCQKQCPLVYWDKICRIRLCQDCFVYGVYIALQKERFIEFLTCPKNHALTYIDNPDLDVGVCNLCKRKTVVKLHCNYCQSKDRFFCCSCKPLSKFTTCYFGHQLFANVCPQNQPCTVCSQKEPEMVGCKKCCFFICKKCQHQYDFGQASFSDSSWMIDQSQEDSVNYPPQKYQKNQN